LFEATNFVLVISVAKSISLLMTRLLPENNSLLGWLLK